MPLMYRFAALFVLAGLAPVAHAEIYTCSGPDGVTSFQQTPCPAPAAETRDPTDSATESSPLPPPPREAESRQADPELVAACKKRYRDEIDRIDAEMREGFEPEERESYREELRALSQRLSRCEYVSDDTEGRSEGPEPTGGDL